MTQLTHEPIDSARLLTEVQSTHAGAVVLFLGTTREYTHGRRTVSLEYECYRDMAQQKLEQLQAEACQKWSLIRCVVVHRLGDVDLGEVSVAVAVSAPHREAAFAAGKWLIDTIKEAVPIWKKENWHDGTSEWVHPGMSK